MSQTLQNRCIFVVFFFGKSLRFLCSLGLENRINETIDSTNLLLRNLNSYRVDDRVRAAPMSARQTLPPLLPHCPPQILKSKAEKMRRDLEALIRKYRELTKVSPPPEDSSIEIRSDFTMGAVQTIGHAGLASGRSGGRLERSLTYSFKRSSFPHSSTRCFVLLMSSFLTSDLDSAAKNESQGSMMSHGGGLLISLLLRTLPFQPRLRVSAGHLHDDEDHVRSQP